MKENPDFQAPENLDFHNILNNLDQAIKSSDFATSICQIGRICPNQIFFRMFSVQNLKYSAVLLDYGLFPRAERIIQFFNHNLKARAQLFLKLRFRTLKHDRQSCRGSVPELDGFDDRDNTRLPVKPGTLPQVRAPYFFTMLLEIV